MKKLVKIGAVLLLLGGVIYLITGQAGKVIETASQQFANDMQVVGEEFANSIQSSLNSSENINLDTTDIIEIDYNVLHQEYQDNPINADAKYKGKILKLTGEIYDIDREIAGNPYVTFHIGNEWSLKDIRLTFKKSQEEKVAQLSKGQTITIKGICQGTLLSTTVALDSCELMEE